MRKVAVILALVLSLAPTISAQRDPVDEEARRAVAEFVAALDALDADAFVACFTDDATIFYPQSSQPERVRGREAIRSSIELEFASARERLADAGRTAPPFLDIEPLVMQVQALSPTIAVVTWQVDRKTHGGRRTAVVQRRGDAWKIASLHSSNMPYPRDDD